MIKIIFMRSKNAFLPEIDAYIDYFNKFKRFKAYDSSKLKKVKLETFDVIWEFKGLGGVRTNKNQILVHEYPSLSTGKFPKLKNYIKSKINPKPDIRIFLNKTVREGFNFNDGIEFCYRDMGIDDLFTSQIKNDKEYDFVYMGSISKEREIDKFLKVFTKKNNGKLCLIGNLDTKIYNKYKKNDNLIFTGKVPYLKVPQIASKARYGINYIPDKYPFNIQTSTKILEYLALGLKVVTTDYKWIRDFEEKHKSSFYKLDYNNLKFNKENIEKHEFVSNFNPQDYFWDNLIENSNIKNKILSLINKKLR
ncbi:glycosyl transferase family 1 [Halanaerobium saccharolyticum]|uniref:Glycosyl transferase family 1 n=1 Tax=Halanaerobium saccharolyticum TaxID=43595 RepID=A0A2T5RH53_9FIRM|nr:glycosyltransferase [Halanaerobium saccharolyticum]PTV95052.1 glycosyl transferase family 1 [Halanaerobium saccharolyticum]